MDLERLIRDVPDFPKPGIIFKDITPLLGDPAGLTEVTRRFTERYRERSIDKVVGIDARGFIFGAALAQALGCGFAPARKPGKLPYKTVSESYTLEYGKDAIALHEDAIRSGERVLVIDDLIATGGTMAATCNLVEKLGGELVEVAAVIELSFLEPRKLIGDRPIFTLIGY